VTTVFVEFDVGLSMSRTTITSQWLRQQLRHSTRGRASVCQLPALGVRSYATQEKDERESFKGQLYHSTHERVQRERADEERFARHRDAQRASGSTLGFAIPIGTDSGCSSGTCIQI
jgi:hypothetical protein